MIRLGDNNEYNAQALVDAFFEAASILDEKNMPKNGRTAVLSLVSIMLVSQVDTNILNRDTQGTNLQAGSGVYSIAGIDIKRSNNLLSWLVPLQPSKVRTTTTVVTSLATLV